MLPRFYYPYFLHTNTFSALNAFFKLSMFMTNVLVRCKRRVKVQ